MNQSDMFQDITYPFRAGSRAGETSEQAARDLQPKLGAAQMQVLHAIKCAGGLAAWELPQYCHGMSYRTAQPRTSELARMGLIKASDERRTDPETGKAAKVWRVA